jgi:hypothetical protein
LQQFIAHCCCSVWSCMRSQGTSFANTHLILRSYVSIAWHVLSEILSLVVISLIIKCQFLRLIHWHAQQFHWFTLLMAGLCWFIVNGNVAVFKMGIPLKCLFLLMLVVASHLFLWPCYQVSSRR